MAARPGEVTVREIQHRGFTLAEILTALVVVAVLVAVAVPMWRNHLLRVQRADAMAALTAVQKEQDSFFGRNARYADGNQLAAKPPGGLGLADRSKRNFYAIEVRTSADGLSYVARARVAPAHGQSDDRRCVEFSLNQNGLRRAVDSEGNDRSGDCWR